MATAGDRIIHQLDASVPATTRPRPARSGTGSSTGTGTGTGTGAGAGAAAGTTATGTIATRRRAKSFLRNYYGIQHTDSSQQDGSKENTSAQAGPVSKSDPYDLDSHAFEVDKYMHKMFVEKQLPGLIQADNELVADIRQLDGDMKTLVYENYSKFLSATDTINKMKSNVDNLESEMSRLTQNIGRIATSSSAIHSSLGSKREKIRQLNGVHSLLTKLQFVFELPTNLHQCLETESYTQAVRSYCRTLHLLQHFKHLTVFTGIERECKIIMVQVAQRIRQKMCAEKATISEILECVGLLLALKEEPVALWKQCLELSMSSLKRVKAETLESITSLPLYVTPVTTSPKAAQTPSSSTSKKARKSARTPSSAGLTATSATTPRDKSTSKGSVPPPAGDKVSYLNAQYLKQVESFVVSFRNYFLVPAPGSTGSAGATNEEAATNGDHRAPAWIAKDARVYASMTAEQQAEASTAVKDAASKLISQYLDIISSFLDYPDDILKIQPEVHVHVLQNLYLGTTTSTGLCQLVGFDALATGLIQNWETRLIEKALGKVREDLLTRIMEQGHPDITSSSSNSLGDTGDIDTAAGGLPERNNNSSSTPPPPAPGLTAVLKKTAEWLLDIFKMNTIPFLEKCMSSDAQFLETHEGRALFLRNFQDGFKAFWDQILNEMQQRSCLMSATSSAGARTCSLIMSRLCFELSNSVVEQLYKSVSRTLFRPGKRNRSGSFLIESYDEPPVIPQLQWDCKAVVQSCQESGHALLDGFIFRTGNELSSKLVSDGSTLLSSQHPHQQQQQSTTAQPWSGAPLDAMSHESPPKGVSDPWEQIYRQLNEIERQVVMAYGDEGDDRQGNHEISSESTRRESVFRTTTATGGGGSHNGNTNTSRLSHRNDSLTSFGSNTMNSRFENQQRNLLLTNIDKLFSDRVEIFVRCQDLNRTGIMFGIIKILLKAWAEAVRMKTFSKGGFQQVQIDAEFAKVWLWRFATADERLMHSLLEETQQTAYRRCIDAVPLDMNTVESIINSSER